MPLIARLRLSLMTASLTVHEDFFAPVCAARERSGIRLKQAATGQWLAEAVATFGLLLTIFGCLARVPATVPYAVGLYISSAYWFTASTSFANPAVTVARSLTNTFAGIAPTGVPMFVAAQFAGMLAALLVTQWLWRPRLTKSRRTRTSKGR